MLCQLSYSRVMERRTGQHGTTLEEPADGHTYGRSSVEVRWIGSNRAVVGGHSGALGSFEETSEMAVERGGFEPPKA